MVAMPDPGQAGGAGDAERGIQQQRAKLVCVPTWEISGGSARHPLTPPNLAVFLP